MQKEQISSENHINHGMDFARDLLFLLIEILTLLSGEGPLVCLIRRNTVSVKNGEAPAEDFCRLTVRKATHPPDSRALRRRRDGPLPEAEEKSDLPPKA